MDGVFYRNFHSKKKLLRDFNGERACGCGRRIVREAGASSPGEGAQPTKHVGQRRPQTCEKQNYKSSLSVG